MPRLVWYRVHPTHYYMQGGRTWWERDEMRREGACEVGGKWDATCEASRQPSVFMLTRRAAVFAAMRPTLLFNPE